MISFEAFLNTISDIVNSETAAVFFASLWLLTILMFLINGRRHNIDFIDFKEMTELKYPAILSKYRKGSEHSIESESVTYTWFVLNKRFMESNDESYIRLGELAYKSYLKFLFSVVFSMVCFIFLVFFYGEQIRNL